MLQRVSNVEKASFLQFMQVFLFKSKIFNISVKRASIVLGVGNVKRLVRKIFLSGICFNNLLKFLEDKKLMNLKDNNKKINMLGEFSEQSLEENFFQDDMKKAMRYIKPIVLMLGILNTLFLIPDYYLIKNLNTYMVIAAGRISFAFLVVGLFFGMNKIKDYKVLAYWITLYEIICILLFLFVFYQYESPDYLIQAFGVMIIIIAVFMVPNKWINMITASLFVSVVFILMSTFYIKVINTEFLAGIVYISIVIVLCSINSFQNHYYKRIQYINNKELIKLSTTDYLSGAYNRAKLDEELKKWVSYSKRYNTSLSIVIYDFDNFKEINDNYGHMRGDNVIIESAEIIRNSIREEDIFSRWGGEEFVILLPNTDRFKAAEMAERLRKKIAGHSFKEVGKVTCSFGVVQLSGDDDMKILLQKVDTMLYSAKKSGKNTVKS